MSIFDDAFGAFAGNNVIAPSDGTGNVGSTPNFPVFSPNGTLLGNLTGNYGQQPSVALPNTTTVPNVGGVTSSPITSAATSAGITGGANPPAATTGSTAQATTPSWFSGYFARGTIIILGFIFVAVGIARFGK